MFVRKSDFLSSFESLKSLRYEFQKFRVNLEGFLLVARDKSKKWKRCNFLDLYDVSASKFCHFSNLGMYFKVIQRFKAKKVTLRERNLQKV